jgi:hypothetical protein
MTHIQSTEASYANMDQGVEKLIKNFSNAKRSIIIVINHMTTWRIKLSRNSAASWQLKPTADFRIQTFAFWKDLIGATSVVSLPRIVRTRLRQLK